MLTHGPQIEGHEQEGTGNRQHVVQHGCSKTSSAPHQVQYVLSLDQHHFDQALSDELSTEFCNLECF